MRNYDFNEQREIFVAAVAILEDYGATEWSFGGGTALSVLHYSHRMSYDIDIFSEDYGLIQSLIENRYEIGKLLGVPSSRIQESPGGLTFILSDKNAKLKLDFVYQSPLTSEPYMFADVFGFKNVKVQNIAEILAKKIKFRTNVTVRDYVDFYFAHKENNGLRSSMSEDITGIERYIDIVAQFNDFNEEYFKQELYFIDAEKVTLKTDISMIINDSITFNKTIAVAYDETGEIVAFDDFIERYRDGYTSVFGEYNLASLDRLATENILGIKDRKLNFSDIYELNINKILGAVIHDDTQPGQKQ